MERNAIRAWFMFDNHTFAAVPLNNRVKTAMRIRQLFDDDGCGSLFVKRHTEKGEKDFHKPLHGHKLTEEGRWGVTDDEILEWLDALYAIPLDFTVGDLLLGQSS